MGLTTQETLFLKRAALKMQKNPALSPIEAMRLVCADDRRIVETVITMPDVRRGQDTERGLLISALSASIYHSIREEKGE